MAVSTQTHNLAFTSSLAILARLGVKAKSGLRAMQTAQMQSTLSSMSDHQLAQIGISRSDIPKYAATLMENE